MTNPVRVGLVGASVGPGWSSIAHIPGLIVQGRYDMICPPRMAHALHKAWPNSTLRLIRNAGHALSEPGISDALVRGMDEVTSL